MSWFRKVDWLAFLSTFAVVWTIYFLTLAPELTLQDCGELVTGSFYAGIPHPPGYPVWTLYSWLWTVLLPVGPIAWRVALGQATSSALACGLLAFMVSRGSSLFLESIQELKGLTGKRENAICLVSGLVAGMLLGLDGFIWSESIVVNRIAVFSLPWFLLLLICLLRWLYAPHQLRYAYLAAFLFGVCITIHQSLVTAAIGLEVVLALGNRRLGRNAFLGNFAVYSLYLAVWLATGHHLFANLARPGLFLLFNVVGIGSLAAAVCLGRRTRNWLQEWRPVFLMFCLFWVGVSFYFYMPISCMSNPPMQWSYPRTVEGFFRALSRGQYQQPDPTNILQEPGRFLSQLGMLFSGVADEFTWMYLLVALVPFAVFSRMQPRERAWLVSLSAMYLCVGVLLMVLLNPTLDRASADLIRVFLTSSHIIVASLIGYGLALTAAYMATHYERFRRWGLAGGLVALLLALYGLYDATGKTYFGRAGWGWSGFGQWLHWIGRAFAKDQYGLPIYANLLLVAIAVAFVGALALYRRRAPLLLTLGLFSLMPGYSALDHWFDSEQRGHWFGYWFGHDMFSPPFQDAHNQALYPPMTRDAILFGGTDPGRFCPEYMVYVESFTPHRCQPAQDQNFDRRDVHIITQNALADDTYLCFIRSHYNRSTQVDPPFFREFFRTVLRDKEYETNLLARAMGPLDRLFAGLGARVEKRRRTYTSWFSESDFIDVPALVARLQPCPQQDPVSRYLYEQLSPESRQGISAQGQEPQPASLEDRLAPKAPHPNPLPVGRGEGATLVGRPRVNQTTGQRDQELALRRSLARDFNRVLNHELECQQQLEARQLEKDRMDQQLAGRSGSERLRRKQAQLAKEIAELGQASRPLYEPERFKQVPISEYLADFIQENPQSHTRVRLNRLLLEAAYPKEIARSIGGVYPDREIYTPTPEDLQQCMQAYSTDAYRRLQHDAQFPNEPKQARADEVVQLADGRLTIGGTAGVMGVSGLLTKVIFDRNPRSEFFVEESFPLDWMYPHLTPFGVIMKINRQPLPSLTEDILQRDHDFWKQYSQRLTGDVIDYDTPVKEVVNWIEKTYLRRDFSGFRGDRKFVRDDDAQKAFSKLRSSIGGLYAWRLSAQCPAEYRPKSAAEVQRLYREAEFAFQQAFAFCPYMPEAVWRYAMLLWQGNRLEDAILVAETCLKLDPYNPSIRGLRDNLYALR